MSAMPAPSRAPSPAASAGSSAGRMQSPPWRWTRFAAPSRFHALAGRLLPWLWAAAALCGAVGLHAAFFVAPTDAVQGEAYRILFVHVPAAWLSMLLYLALAGWAAVGWAFNVRTAAMLARAIAPTGLMFTALALWTGACWGRPTWGTWWVWDARLTSELILFFLFAGQVALANAIDDPRRADIACALLALVGVVNVPVIYFSVRWWNTLHQGASITLGAPPQLAAPMLAALGWMTAAAWLYALAAVLARARAIVLEREREAGWVQALLTGPAEAAR